MLIDAHNHLQDNRLEGVRESFMAEKPAGYMVVNGTKESDWQSVLELCQRGAGQFLPAVGCHPWWVAGRSPDWLERLEAIVALGGVSLGEVGLDRWIEGHDLDDQLEVLRGELGLAVKYNLPVTIHCLKAWGALVQLLEEVELPRCGFLLHSFGGSLEVARKLVKKGAYFSLSGYFAHERKEAQREIWRQLPLDRLLIETDAPDMCPPKGMQVHELKDEAGNALNHPANLGHVYSFAAGLYDISRKELEGLVETNFYRLFGECYSLAGQG